jgi:hypothetical protein
VGDMAVRAAIEDALDWLAGQPVSDVGLEAAAAAGADATRFPRGEAWYGRLAVPSNGQDAGAPLREILAVALTGADATRYPDPVRGHVDLVAQLWGNAPGALNASSDAVQAFQVLAMRAAGTPATDGTVQALADALAAKQGEDGGWGCGGASSSDCTGFAVAALSDAGRPPAPAPVLAYLASTRNDDGGFAAQAGGTSSTQSTAWAMAAYRGLGLEAPATALAFLLSQQEEDGSFRCWTDEAPCARLPATAEAVVALAGSHPITPAEPFQGEGRGSPALSAVLLPLLLVLLACRSRA